jgi:cytochrome c oxidase cbb3-type subunit IV
MKIAKNILEGVEGLEFYPIVGMLIFLIFFIALIAWVISLKPEDVDTNSHLPLTDGEDEPSMD